jgi:hypothetical protein
VDGKIFQSIRLLYTRPGRLTTEYCQGRRASHVGPIRLYLTFSVAFFAVSSLVPIQPVVVQPERPRQGLTISTRSERPSGTISFSGATSLSGEELGRRVREAEHVWLPRAMFVLVPIFALLVKWLTRRTRRRYPQHLYFALHVHAAYFGLLALTTLLSVWHIPSDEFSWSPIRALLTLVYLSVAFRNVYGGSWLRSAWRSASLMVSYMTLVLIVFGAIVAFAFAGAKSVS